MTKCHLFGVRLKCMLTWHPCVKKYQSHFRFEKSNTGCRPTSLFRLSTVKYRLVWHPYNGNAMRKMILESFSVRNIEHELSVKVISVDLKSLQYTFVLYWSEFCTIRVNIRTTISVYSTKNPHKPRQVFLGPRFHNFFTIFFWKYLLFYIHLTNPLERFLSGHTRKRWCACLHVMP